MRRRAFLAVLGGAAAAWPLAVRAQAPMPVIGLLNSGRPRPQADRFVAFRRGLRQAGFTEGRNVTIDYRWAEDRYDRLPELAGDLARRNVTLIAATGGPVVALAAKRVTSTIPIVFTAVADPVSSGLVASLNRPGGNATGTAGLTMELDPKRLELLHQMVPGKGVIGVLVNPNRPSIAEQSSKIETAARAIGRSVQIERCGTPGEIEHAFEALVRRNITAVLIAADPLFNSRRAQLIAAARRHAMATIFQWREFAEEGGLMSYGPNVVDMYFQSGVYAGRILKGEKPADLPVVQPTKFELVVNRKTAADLGLKIPPRLLALADGVIE